MSLFGAMNTAISGLSAQSNAFGNISDNVANSQTVGYKRVDTAFIDYLTTSTAANNVPGAVVTRPDYVNNVEGTITQTDNTARPRDHRPGVLRGLEAGGDGQQPPDIRGAAGIYPRRRLPDGQERLPGELGRPVPQRLAGQTRHRRRQPEYPGADPGLADRLQPGRHRRMSHISANLPATPTPGTATASRAIYATDADVITAVTAAATDC